MTTFDGRVADLQFRAQARRDGQARRGVTHRTALGGDEAVAAELGEGLTRHGQPVARHRISHRRAEPLAGSVDRVKRG